VILLAAKVAGAVLGTPAGFETVLATTVGDLEIAVAGFTAAEAEVTLFGSATGTFGLLLRNVRPVY